MNKIPVLILLLLAGCVGENNQDILIAIHKCEVAELRAVGLYNSAGELYIQCRPHTGVET